jgi:cation diffusion facilitator CzcD-associated flavoprotein CzcO
MSIGSKERAFEVAMPEGGAEHVDVVIVGVGLSGVSAACHLRSKCPGKRLAVLEARDVIGGT